MKRRRILKIAWLAALLLLPVPIHAQDAKLIEAAKKEGGKVVFMGRSRTTPWISSLRRSRPR